MKSNIVKNAKAGFSLVEMLVVIAVIGVIAAIAVPTIGNITGSAKESTDKRNGQNLASVYSAAIAAGATFAGTAPFDAAEKAVIATALATGVTGSVETGFDTTIFKVPAISNVTEVLADHIDGDFSYKP